MSLQDAKLARLNKLANLRKASRQYREALGEIRSAMAAANHEIDLIERQLERIVQFPAPITHPEVKVLSEAEEARQDRINKQSAQEAKKTA